MHFQVIQCKKVIVNLLKDKYLVFGLEGDKSLYFRGFHYIVTIVKLPLIVICHLAIGTIDYILTICKVINNNKTVMIQLLAKARYIIDFCDNFFPAHSVIWKKSKNELLGALVNRIFFLSKWWMEVCPMAACKKSQASVFFHKKKILSFEAIYCSAACMVYAILNQFLILK